MKRALLNWAIGAGFIAIYFVGLSLSGCGSIIPPSATVAVAQGDTSVDLAYNVAAQAYIAALPTMPPAIKAEVKPLLVKAYAYVQAADTAEKLGDATTVTLQAQNALTLIGQAKSVLGAK